MSKLTPLPKRLHNILFHTHTVSGIVLSFVLFVIFFCGAISLFRHELYQWENSMARFESSKKVDYNKVVNILKNNSVCLLLDQGLSIIPPKIENPFIKVFYAEEQNGGEIKRKTASIDPRSYTFHNDLSQKTTLANTIYRLHYLRQIPIIGIYISGFAGLFLIFAMVTGLFVHWKNIVEKFHAFQWKGSWKRIWAEGHISLGFLTLPIQFIYGVSGALLGLSILLLLPSLFLFGGDRNKVFEVIRPEFAIQYDKEAPELQNTVSLNNLYKTISSTYPNFNVTRISLQNFNREDGTATLYYTDHKGLMGDGTTVFNLKDATVAYNSIPYQKSYASSTFALLIKLHYVTFGGLALKIIYFILALITCYVITSGNMLWQAARNNKKYTDKQRKFHFQVTRVYLSITFSLVCATAIIFIGNKLIPLEMHNRVLYVNTIFFSGWLLIFLLGLLYKSFKSVTKFNLITLSILSFGVASINGLITGDWMWKTFKNHQYYVAYIDLIWAVTAIISLVIFIKIKKDASDIEH